MPYSTLVLLYLILGYGAFKVIGYLVRQEHAGEYINIHIDLYGKCDYIRYRGREYYPVNKGGVFCGGKQIKY